MSGKPEGFQSLTPHLVVQDAPAAIDFYKKAFNATELVRLTSPDGKVIVHACLQIGDSKVMLCEEMKECGNMSPKSLPSSPVSLHLYVDSDVDGAFKKAVNAGATPLMEPQDMFWGDRYGRLKDPFGHEWSLAMHVREVSPEELKAGAASCVPA